MEVKYIFKSTGKYLGFIKENNLFSRDGDYLGWSDNVHVWDRTGVYRGELKDIEGHSYILKNQFAIPPLQKNSKDVANSLEQPDPPSNIAQIQLPIGYIDGFK